MTLFSEMPSGFTLNVKAFREKTSPFTLNSQGISENSFTVDVKKYTTHQIFFILSQPSNSRKEGEAQVGGGSMKINGIVWNPLDVLRSARTKRDRLKLNSESGSKRPVSSEVIKS